MSESESSSSQLSSSPTATGTRGFGNPNSTSAAGNPGRRPANIGGNISDYKWYILGSLLGISLVAFVLWIRWRLAPREPPPTLVGSRQENKTRPTFYDVYVARNNETGKESSRCRWEDTMPLAVWPIPTESPRTTLKGGEIPINPRARVAVLLSLPVDSGHTQTCDAHHGHLPHFEIGTLELDLPP